MQLCLSLGDDLVFWLSDYLGFEDTHEPCDLSSWRSAMATFPNGR